MNNIKKVSIIIPARNEDQTLGNLLEECIRVLSSIEDTDFEIVVVNDHSNDNTEKVAAGISGVRIARNLNRIGKGNALIAGFQLASGDVIIMMDGDGSHLAKDIPRFLNAFENDIGLVIGSRKLGGSDEYTCIKAVGNLVISAFFSLLFKQNTTDAINGYKAFRRQIIEGYSFCSTDFEIEIELLAITIKRGFRIKEIPSYENKRKGGKSKLSIIYHGLRFFLQIIKERNKFLIKGYEKA